MTGPTHTVYQVVIGSRPDSPRERRFSLREAKKTAEWYLKNGCTEVRIDKIVYRTVFKMTRAAFREKAASSKKAARKTKSKS